MDEQAVKTLKDLLRSVVPGQETAIDVSRELLGDDGKDGRRIVLAVQQRRLNAEPTPDPIREPSPRRTHEFFDVDGFTQYLKKFGGESTVILADPIRQRVSAVLDERAERGFEVLVFSPLVHPLFAPWAKALGSSEAGPGGPASTQMPLKEFLRFVAENRRQIVAPEGRALALLLSQVRMSRKIELAQGFGAQCLNGLMVETAIQGQAGARMEPVELPETLVVECPLYVATAARTMEIDLALEGDVDQGVLVTLSSGDLPVVRVAAFEEMLEIVRREVGDEMTVGLGSPRHGDWRYLPAPRA